VADGQGHAAEAVSTPLFPTPWMYGQRKLTRVEIAVYAGIVAALIAVFASYMIDYMEMAEKTAMQTTLSNMNTGLNLDYAGRLIAGERMDKAGWMSGNPFALARTFPPGYGGELAGRDAASLPRPAWIFDPARREIVYLPRLHKHLRGTGEAEIRFRLDLHPSGFGFVLVPVSPYDWSLSESETISHIACRRGCTPLFS
jgi:hypothetical protein